MRKKPYRLVLASTSPRRIELLRQAGLAVTAHAPDTDERLVRGELPRAMVRRLAREKAQSVASRLGDQGDRAGLPTLVIAADTTVVAPDGRTILGKPVDARDAARMLNKLSGNVHTVLSGYCILPLGLPAGLAKGRNGSATRPVERVVRSRVRIRSLSRADIAAYVRTREPMDKAGSYAAQGIGMSLVESLTGSYTNVVGLPMCQLLQDLEERFGLRLFEGR